MQPVVTKAAAVQTRLREEFYKPDAEFAQHDLIPGSMPQTKCHKPPIQPGMCQKAC